MHSNETEGEMLNQRRGGRMKRCKDCNCILWPWSLTFDERCYRCDTKKLNKDMTDLLTEIQRRLIKANANLDAVIEKRKEVLK